MSYKICVKSEILNEKGKSMTVSRYDGGDVYYRQK